MNIDSETKQLVVRLAAICAAADGLDADGAALPFEEGAIRELGSEYGLSEEETLAQVNQAKEGLNGVSAEDWSSLASLDAESKNTVLEKLNSIAAADSEFSEGEKNTITIIRAKIGA